MKIRKSFVANSSSSNFCVLGFNINSKKVDNSFLNSCSENDVSLFFSGNWDDNDRQYYASEIDLDEDTLPSNILIGVEVSGKTIQTINDLAEKLTSTFNISRDELSVFGWGFWDG